MAASPLLRVVREPLRTEWRGVTVSSVCTIARTGVSLARPWPLALAIDHVIGGEPTFDALAGVRTEWLLVLAGVATVLLTAGSGLLERASVATGEAAAERVGAAIRADAFERGMSLSLPWHDRIRSGELIARITSDVGRVIEAVTAIITILAPELLALVGVVVVLLVIDPALALIGLLLIPVLAALTMRQRGDVRAARQEARHWYGELAGVGTDLASHVAAVQAYGRADHARAEFGRCNSQLLRADTAAAAVEARWLPRADVALSVGTGLVVIWGGLAILDGTQTLGHLIVALAYVAGLHTPIRSLSGLAATAARAEVSAERIAEILDADEVVREAPDARTLPPGAPPVRLRDVSFEYQPGRPVLTGVDIAVAPGELVCLTGPSGLGKSTVLRLLLRLYDAQAGEVLVHGIDVRDCRLDSLRRQIAYVPQDPWLLNASLAHNIAFGRRSASRVDVIEAGCVANVAEFVERLSDGYDTPVGEGGARLSRSQQCRVALARAVASGAPLLLLDEPTSALNANSARPVVDAIAASSRGRTTVVVTQDPRLMRIADRVVDIAGLPHPSPVREEPRVDEDLELTVPLVASGWR